MSEFDQSSASNSVLPSLMRLRLRKKKTQRSSKEELSGWNNGNSPSDENDCFFHYEDQHQSNPLTQPQYGSPYVVSAFGDTKLNKKSNNSSVCAQIMDFSSFQTEGVYRKVETLGELHENLLDQKKKQLFRTRESMECEKSSMTNKQKPEYVSEKCFVMKIKGKQGDTCPLELKEKKVNEFSRNMWSNTQQDLRYPCDNQNSEQVDAIQELKQISGFLSSPKHIQPNSSQHDRTNQLPIFINRRTPLIQIISKSRAATPFQNNNIANNQQTQPVPWRISLNKVRCAQDADNNNTALMENNKYLNFSTEFIASKDLVDERDNDSSDQAIVEIDQKHNFKKKQPKSNNENVPNRSSQIYFSRNTSVTPSQSRKQSMENSHMIPAFLPRVVRNSIGANKHAFYQRESQNLVKNNHKDRLEENTGQATVESKQASEVNTNIYLKHMGNYNTTIKRRSCSSISKLKPPLDEKSSQRTIKCVPSFDVEDQDYINQQGRGQLENKFRSALSQYFSNDSTKPIPFKLSRNENSSQGEQLTAAGLVSKPPKDTNIRSQKKRSSLHAIISNSPKNKKKIEDFKDNNNTKNKEILNRTGGKLTTRSSSAQPANKQGPQFIICQRVTVEQVSKTLKRESLESEGSVSYNGTTQKQVF